MYRRPNFLSKIRKHTGYSLIALNFLLHATSFTFADTLAPLVSGGVIDSSPKDGIGDVLDSGPFIANVSGGQYRAIVEYDLTSIPDGTVLSASLTGQVGPNNSVDVGLREHLVEVYTGNGIVDLSDYGLPGIEAGRFSHESGGRTDFEFDIAGVLNNLLSAGADYLGMRISPLTETLPFDVLSTSEFFDPPRLHFELLPEGAATKQFLPAFDARVISEDGQPFQLREGDNTISLQRIDFADIDRRGVLEYDLSELPTGAIITDAKMTFDIWGYSGGSNDTVDAPIYAYPGDGLPAVQDAFETSTPIGVLGPIDSLDDKTIDIDHNVINDILESSDFLGLALLGDPDFNSVTFSALEFGGPPSFIPPTQLFLTYILPPDPADFDGNGTVDGADLAVWKAAYAVNANADSDTDGDTDGQDFLLWQRNITSMQALAVSTQVPEPSTVTLLLLMATGISQFRCNR